MTIHNDQHRFNHFETTILQKLIAHREQQTLSLHDILIDLFFTKNSGRSLIIQLQEQYAMYYLPVEVFNDTNAKSKEVNLFIQFFSLINYLNTHGYITIYKDGHHLKQQIYYVGEGYDQVKVDHGKLILNAEGLYSVKPEEIKDQSGTVVGKGIEFKDNDLAIKNTVGNIFISDKLEHLLDTSPEPVEKKKKRRFPILKICNLLLLKVIILFAYFAKEEIKDHINKSEGEFNTKIAALSTRLENKIKSDSLQYIETQHQFLASQQKQIIPKKTTKEYGIDISRWNGNIFTKKIPKKISFIICKSTEGSSYTDPMFAKNWKRIKKAKRTRGAYHFYVSNDDPVAQAEHFWNNIKTRSSSDLPPIVDIERGSLKQNTAINPINLQVDLLYFLKHLKKLSGTTPMIYSSYSFANTYLTNDKFAEYPLWIADYTKNSTPKLPVAWKEKGFKIWQKSNKYSLGSSYTDYDIYYKTEEETQLVGL